MSIFAEAVRKIYGDTQHDFKHLRGYGIVYDAIISHYGQNCDITELGIGGGKSHIRWAHITSGNVVGVDISGPSIESMQASKHIQYDAPHPRQVENYWKLMETLDTYSPQIKDKLKLFHNMDAFDDNTAKFVTETVGQQRIVINDSKHRAFVWQNFDDTWMKYIADDGVLIQEEIARDPDDGTGHEYADEKYLKNALDQGWLIYDFSSIKDIDRIATDGESSNANYMGVKFKNPEMASILDPIKHRLYKSNGA